MGYQVYAVLTVGVCGEEEYAAAHAIIERYLVDWLHPPAPVEHTRKGYRCIVCSWGRSFGDAGDEVIAEALCELAELRRQSGYENLAWALVSFWGDQDGARVERCNVHASVEPDL